MRIYRRNENRTSLYLAALKAIRDLREAEGDLAVEEICAESSAPLERDAFLAREKVSRREADHVCEKRFNGALKCSGHSIDREPFWSLPAMDHADEWLKDGRTHLITSQPYGLSYKDLKDIVGYCNANSLEASVDASSWHFPGRTLLLTYRKAKASHSEITSDVSPRTLTKSEVRALIKRKGYDWSYCRRKDGCNFAVYDIRQNRGMLEVKTCEGWLIADKDQFSYKVFQNGSWSDLKLVTIE